MLHIKCRLQLSVHHMVIFHVHEGGVMIGLRVAVSPAAPVQLCFIFFDFFKGCLQIFDISLQLLLSMSSPGYKFDLIFFCH